MSSATPKRPRTKEKQALLNIGKDHPSVDPNTFRADIERHQIKIHQGRPLKGHTNSIGESAEPTIPKKKDPSKRQKRKKTHSFIKIKAGEISSEIDQLQASQPKRILALKLPNGIELEFWS